MTTTVVTPASLLLTAADLIEERGKAQGLFQGADGCLCAIGALRLAAFGKVTCDIPTSQSISDPGRLYWLARSALSVQVELLAPQHRFGAAVSVVSWSDATPQDVVVATLRAAAELAGTGVAS
jgi:hypothetical protein